MTAIRRRVLMRIYRSFLASIASIASILAEEAKAPSLREATEHRAAYHLAGRRTFFAARVAARGGRG